MIDDHFQHDLISNAIEVHPLMMVVHDSTLSHQGAHSQIGNDDDAEIELVKQRWWLVFDR